MEESKTISVEIPAGKAAKWVNGVLTLVDEKDNRPVIERVKTFGDAVRELGDGHPLVLAYTNMCDSLHGDENKDVVAYLKLRIIATALNEGWAPRFSKDECRYYPWFDLYTKEEFDKMDKDGRKQLWLFGGSSNYGSQCGLADASSSYVWSHSASSLSARLAVRTSELAKYFGRQFIGIWADYVYWSK